MNTPMLMFNIIFSISIVLILAVIVQRVLGRMSYTFSVENRRQWKRFTLVACVLSILLMTIGLQVNPIMSFYDALLWVSPAIFFLILAFMPFFLIVTPGWRVRTSRSETRFDPDIRIGIIGAGPSGLSAAEELRNRGYRNITILEARPDPGGKSITREVDGITYDGGQVWAVPSGCLNRYYRKYAIPDILRDLPRMQFLTREGKEPQNPWVMKSKLRWRFSPMRFVEIIRYSFALRPLASLDSIGFRDSQYQDPIYAESSAAWFKRKNLPFMEEALGPIIQVACAGHLVDRMPFGYVAKVLGLFQRYSFAQILSLSLPGHRFKEGIHTQGNQALWIRMAASHQGFRPGERVDAIERGETIRVTTSKSTYEFDHLIWAAPPMVFPRIVKDATVDERELFSRVQTYRRAVVIARFEGLPEGRLWLYRTTEKSGLPISHPRVVYGLQPGTNLFKCFPGMEKDGSIREITDELNIFANQHAAKLVNIVSVHQWEYYPHFSSEDVRNGAWRRQEELQGRNRTWFVGELFSGLGVPLAVEYSADLIENRF